MSLEKMLQIQNKISQKNFCISNISLKKNNWIGNWCLCLKCLLYRNVLLPSWGSALVSWEIFCLSVARLLLNFYPLQLFFSTSLYFSVLHYKCYKLLFDCTTFAKYLSHLHALNLEYESIFPHLLFSNFY